RQEPRGRRPRRRAVHRGPHHPGVGPRLRRFREIRRQSRRQPGPARTGGMTMLRLGMVGGGQGAYIGNTHRLASRLDGQWQLVAGAFDVDPERGRAFAISQGLDPARSYGTYQDLIAGETAREDRVDAVAICTANFTHYPIAKALIEAGFDVICEKPLTATLEDAVALEKLARESGRFVGVTYTYSGYPMVHEARVRVARGELGPIRTVQVEYPLEWMATAIEQA